MDKSSRVNRPESGSGFTSHEILSRLASSISSTGSSMEARDGVRISGRFSSAFSSSVRRSCDRFSKSSTPSGEGSFFGEFLAGRFLRGVSGAVTSSISFVFGLER